MGGICIEDTSERDEQRYREHVQRELDAEPLFLVIWSHERPGAPIPLAAMLAANADDENLCKWLSHADRVGLEYRVGGGTSPLCVIRRVEP